LAVIEKSRRPYERKDERIDTASLPPKAQWAQTKFERYSTTAKPFCTLIKELIPEDEWNYRLFVLRTGLEQSVFYRISRNEAQEPEIETILAISVGYRFSPNERNQLIASAGRTYKPTKAHFYYQLVFEKYVINSVEDFNIAFSELMGVEGLTPLGAE